MADLRRLCDNGAFLGDVGGRGHVASAVPGKEIRPGDVESNAIGIEALQPLGMQAVPPRNRAESGRSCNNLADSEPISTDLVEVGPNVPKFGTNSTNLGQFGPESIKLVPIPTDVPPNSAIFGQPLTKFGPDPMLTKFRPNLTNINSARKRSKLALNRP